MFHRTGILLAILALAALPATAGDQAEPPFTIQPPRVALRGIEVVVAVEPGALPGKGPFTVRLADDADRVLAEAALPAGRTAELRFRMPETGTHRLRVVSPEIPGATTTFPLRVVPGWWSLAPPFVAILLALVFRQVVPALLAGIWLGASIISGNPLSGILRMLDRYVIGALADGDHISIVVFSLLLGGMVGVIARSGGTVGLVDALASRATSSRGGQLVTWAMGIAVFFDDYANTLVVGNTMRPVTDRLRVSREKLAYIVDSTAAPVAAIGIISTWIGYEVSLIGDALKAVGSDLDAYSVFLQSIPFNFYPLLALAFGFYIAWTGRDFGPMRKAETRAGGGKLMRDGAVPLSDFDNDALKPVPGKPQRWYNAVVPVLSVVAVTFIAQWFTGRIALAADGDPLGAAGLLSLGFRDLGTVFAAGNSFHSLLYASATGCVLAIVMARVQGILPLAEGIYAWIQGMKSMLLAFIILTLAWSIAGVCADLHASGFVADALSGAIDPRALPILVFLFAAVIAFATGTSWATMGILVPLAVPAAFGVAQAAGYDAVEAHRIFLGSVSAVLAGAIFGDHCSPISDTTVLSSMSSGCDHIDHVRTQLPYALVVAVAAMVLGYLPCAFGLSPWIALPAGAVVLYLVVRLIGRPSA